LNPAPYNSDQCREHPGFFYRPIPFALSTVLYEFTHANPIYFHLLQFILFIVAVYILFLFLGAIKLLFVPVIYYEWFKTRSKED